MAEFYDRRRFRIDDIADLFLGTEIPEVGEVLRVIQRHADYAKLAPKYGADFARQAREEVAARRWYRSLLERLGAEPERYIFLGKRVSELGCDSSSRVRESVELDEAPLPLCGPMVVLGVAGKPVEVRKQHPADSFGDAPPVFSLYGPPSVPCLIAPCTWLGIHPGSSVQIIRPPIGE